MTTLTKTKVGTGWIVAVAMMCFAMGSASVAQEDPRQSCGRWMVNKDNATQQIVALQSSRIVRVCLSVRNAQVKVSVGPGGEVFGLKSLHGMRCIDVEGQSITIKYGSTISDDSTIRGVYCLPRQ